MCLWKRITILTLCLGLLAGGMPLLSRAEEDTTPCTHHTLHTQECGYREAADAVPCDHQHDESCNYVEAAAEIPCNCQVTVTHENNCSYKPASAGQSCDCTAAEEGGEVQHVDGCGYEAPTQEIPCSCTPVTTHADGCAYTPAREESCDHQHGETCSYAEAVEAAPCQFVCEDCKAVPAPINEDNTPQGFYAVDGNNNVFPAGQRMELPAEGSVTEVTFYFNGTPISPSSLTAGGVVALTAGTGNICNLTTLGQGMGAITYAENGNYHVLEVGHPIDQEQELVFKDLNVNDYFGRLVVPVGQTRRFPFYRTPKGAGQFTAVTSGITCGGVATATPNSDGTYTIGVMAEGTGYLYHLGSDGRVASMRIETQESGGGNGGNHERFEVNYGGKTIILGLGEMMNGALHMFAPGVVGDYYMPGTRYPFQRQVVLGALEIQNNGNGDVTLAPAEFFNCISNVQVAITSCENEDGSTNGSNCFLVDDPSVEFTPAMQMQASKQTIQGVSMHQFYVMADPCMGFEAELVITFDLTLNGEKKSYTIHSRAGYWGPTVINIDAPATAAELNSMLESYSNLEAYLQQKDSRQYETLRRTSQSEGPENPMIYIHLPEATYTEPIAYKIRVPGNTYLANIELIGSGSGKTILPGLEVGGYLTHVYDIGFVSNDAVTSGIWVNEYGIDVERIVRCCFRGFDYGIRSEGSKFVRSIQYCTFENCENGIYMDVDQDDEDNINDGVNYHNTFRNCRYAVRLKNLPQQMKSYHFRMSDSIFESNFKDFHITTSGNKHYYYFYRNYYNGTYTESGSGEQRSGSAFRDAKVDTTGSEAVIITNPCRTSAAEDSPLWIFGGVETRIFNSEAYTMPVSGDAFAAGEYKEVTLISDREEEVATWIFGDQAS